VIRIERSALKEHYAVIGNPVAHSKSPDIHAMFAGQTGQDIVYDRLLAPLDAFEDTARQFFSAGGKGLNVTVPFKHEAWDIVDTHADSARDAAAVNTIRFEDDKLVGYNTDGIGLVGLWRDVSPAGTAPGSTGGSQPHAG